jgi:Uma2 family endonuclease
LWNAFEYGPSPQVDERLINTLAAYFGDEESCQMSATSETATPYVGQPAVVPVPPLTNGDQLTQAEFLRRYSAMPHLNDAELIEGTVYMPSPVTHEHHSAPHFDLIGWLCLYRMHTPGIRGGDNGTLRLDLKNAPQPDAYLIVESSHGGQVRIDADGFIVGAPELVAEVAATSAAIDLHGKLAAYQRNGVREYLVWRVFDRAIDWFVAREGVFERMVPRAGGPLQSEVLPGLWLEPAALIAGDMLAVERTVRAGVESPEHATFVDRLRKRAAETRS